MVLLIHSQSVFASTRSASEQPPPDHASGYHFHGSHIWSSGPLTSYPTSYFHSPTRIDAQRIRLTITSRKLQPAALVFPKCVRLHQICLRAAPTRSRLRVPLPRITHLPPKDALDGSIVDLRLTPEGPIDYSLRQTCLKVSSTIDSSPSSPVNQSPTIQALGSFISDHRSTTQALGSFIFDHLGRSHRLQPATDVFEGFIDYRFISFVFGKPISDHSGTRLLHLRPQIDHSGTRLLHLRPFRCDFRSDYV
ncbi:hypothetical protein L2E82_30618 [Cichorium intybus]|uniref:Uncharacterized protein n=1 Tax=Cichorium intybus TaxID=13427 RepID=A0ACB9D179_CICIN|nr:hypothetical protein L2E82_30618 [Cichorium intybus]